MFQMYRFGSFCLGFSMLLLQGCSDSNVETVREAKYEGKHKIGVLLDNRKECNDQEWESKTDASDNVVVTVLCTFKLPDVLVDRALTAKNAEVNTRKEWLLESYFKTRQDTEDMYNNAIESVDRVKGDYEVSIAEKQSGLNYEKSVLAEAQATGQPENSIQVYTQNVEYMTKQLEETQEYLRQSTVKAQENVVLRKSQLDYLISIEEKAKSAADEYASNRWSAYESELKKNTKVTNMVAFELLESGPKLAAYKTVSRSDYATIDELLDRSIPDSRLGALGFAMGLRSDNETTLAGYFTQEVQTLSPGFSQQERPEPFSCSIYNDGVELCVFK